MSRVLGPYTLGAPLGSIALGDLVEAAHASRREPLLVLFLAEELIREHRFRGLLRLEVSRAGGLRHPAVARPIEVGEHAGSLYVVFERPAGEPLAERLAGEVTLSAGETLGIVQRLAEGLDAAHGRRLVHGAISPATVVGPDGTASVVGLGLLAAVDDAHLTEVARARLDQAFAAPEQADGRLAVASADGYALGVLASRLVTDAASRAGSPVPAAVTAALARQHSPDPATRFPSCLAFAAALAEAQQTAPAAAEARLPTPAAPGVARPETRPVAPPAPAPTRAPAPTPAPATSEASRLTPTADPAPGPTAPLTSGVSRVAPGPAASLAPAQATRPRTRPRQTVAPSQPVTQVSTEERGPETPIPPLGSLTATPAMRICLERCYHAAGIRLLLAAGAPLVLALVGLTFSSFFLFMALISAIALGTHRDIIRAYELRQAQANPRIERVRGPLTATEHRVSRRSSKSSYKLHLPNGDVLDVDERLHADVAFVGYPIGDERLRLGRAYADLSSAYQLDDVLVTYSWTGRVVFDVRTLRGTIISCNPDYPGEHWDR